MRECIVKEPTPASSHDPTSSHLPIETVIQNIVVKINKPTEKLKTCNSRLLLVKHEMTSLEDM